jgi:hypothetical protein
MDSKIIYYTKKRRLVKNFLEALYGFIDQGGKYKNLKIHYQISSARFYDYLNICEQYEIFEKFQRLLLSELKQFVSLDTVTDTFTVRAKGAIDEAGYHYKEKNKIGTSVSIIADINKIPLICFVGNARIDDREMLWLTLGDPEVKIQPIAKIYADKGYVGKNFEKIIKTDHNIDLICYPKRTRGTVMTHTLDRFKQSALKKYRIKIEHVNNSFRNFRLIDVRYCKKIIILNYFVNFACLLIAVRTLKNLVTGNISNCS